MRLSKFYPTKDPVIVPLAEAEVLRCPGTVESDMKLEPLVSENLDQRRSSWVGRREA
jgi:hypothetical protein